MSNQLTNLLPGPRRKALRREYVYRLGVVALSLVIALTVVAASLLLPTYVFLLDSVKAKQVRLESIQSTLSSTDEVAISARLKALSDQATALSLLAAQPSPTRLVGNALTVPRTGVTLSGLSYKPLVGKTPATLSITGTAATRAALRAYQLAFQDMSFVKSANLPVSAYAQDTDIGFTITLTLQSL